MHADKYYILIFIFWSTYSFILSLVFSSPRRPRSRRVRVLGRRVAHAHTHTYTRKRSIKSERQKEQRKKIYKKARSQLACVCAEEMARGASSPTPARWLTAGHAQVKIVVMSTSVVRVFVMFDGAVDDVSVSKFCFLGNISEKSWLLFSLTLSSFFAHSLFAFVPYRMNKNSKYRLNECAFNKNLCLHRKRTRENRSAPSYALTQISLTLLS
jgi:hypothetical protein